MSEATATAGEVLAVCVLHTERDSGTRRVDPDGDRQAARRRPRARRDRLGLDGDHVCDTEYHGGPFKAVYAYREDEAQRWARSSAANCRPGWFGENLRIDGIAATDAVIGDALARSART